MDSWSQSFSPIAGQSKQKAELNGSAFLSLIAANYYSSATSINLATGANNGDTNEGS